MFRAYLPAYASLLPYLTGLLQPAELERARRYYHPHDQRRFSVCRALLRVLLAGTTGAKPQDISVAYHPSKKPYLASHPALYFNISHAAEYAVFAFADQPVGIDVEKLQRGFSFQETLPHVFGAAETAAVQQAADPAAAFYSFWTRKEALVKASGKGIDDDFRQVPATDGWHSLPPALLGSTATWQVRSFAVAAEYVGAVAYAGTTPEPPRCYALPTTLSELLHAAATPLLPGAYSFSE